MTAPQPGDLALQLELRLLDAAYKSGLRDGAAAEREHDHPHGSMCPGHVPDDCPKCANAAAAERAAIIRLAREQRAVYAPPDADGFYRPFADLLDGDPA